MPWPPPSQPEQSQRRRRQLLTRVGVLLGAAVGGDVATTLLLQGAGRLPGLLADNWTHAALAGLCWWAVLALAPAAETGEEDDDDDASSSKRRALLEVGAAACAGSLLDLDHFLAAGSLTRLEPALSLPTRPAGHCLTTLLLGGAGVFVVLRVARAGGCCCLASCLRPFQGQRGGNNRWAAATTTTNSHHLPQQRAPCVPPASAPLRWAALLVTATLSHQLRDAVRRGLWLCPLHYSTPALPYPVYLALLALLPLLTRRLLAWGAPPKGGSASSSLPSAYRRVQENDWEAEWGDQESESEDEDENGVELPAVVV